MENGVKINNPGSDWKMEMDETAANQDSMSAYEFTDDETEPHKLCEASHTRNSPYVSPYLPRRRRVEINYDSEDDYRYGNLYKRDQGESIAYNMPEDPNDVVFPGVRPKAKAKGDEEGDESYGENGNEFSNETPGRRVRKKERDLMVMLNADHLTERQYKNFLVNLDYEKMNDVINSVAFHTIEKSQSVRGSNRYVNDPEEDPENPYKPILYHKIIEKRLRVRSINHNGLVLARCHLDDMCTFTKIDRVRYKMLIMQMLDNLNYMCAP